MKIEWFFTKLKDLLSKLKVSENKFTSVGGKTTKKALLCFKDLATSLKQYTTCKVFNLGQEGFCFGHKLGKTAG